MSFLPDERQNFSPFRQPPPFFLSVPQGARTIALAREATKARTESSVHLSFHTDGMRRSSLGARPKYLQADFFSCVRSRFSTMRSLCLFAAAPPPLCRQPHRRFKGIVLRVWSCSSGMYSQNHTFMVLLAGQRRQLADPTMVLALKLLSSPLSLLSSRPGRVTLRTPADPQQRCLQRAR